MKKGGRADAGGCRGAVDRPVTAEVAPRFAGPVPPAAE